MSIQTYLFSFTIGPVQSFIAQARKTSDFYAGSCILSELTSTAIQTFKEHSGEVVFPNPENEAKPNRFLGKIQGEADLKTIGQKIEQSVRQKFKDIAENALKNAEISQKPQGFDEQIESHLEIFWLFEPIENNDFERAYKNIERNMGAIKNVRTFTQLAERGRKCSTDGEKNALFYKKRENGQIPNHLNRNAVEVKNVNDVIFAKGEALSAVSLLKRFYEANSSFPSVASIATMNIQKQLEQLPEFKEYKNFFKNEWDERLLYEENLNEKEITKKKLNEAKTKYSELSKILSKKGIKLYKYYAILVFDGDRMGKILSGAYLTNKTKLEEYQKLLSELLRNYAKLATDCVNEYGRTIYAGGDDFVGFINLEYLFDVLMKLRESFEKNVNQKLQKEYPLTENNVSIDFTFSAGVCIAHYKTPLGVVLKTAKKMEDKAKNAGRNALGMAVLKHSGEQHETVLKWEANSQNVTRMKELIQALEEKFSDTWIKNIEQEFTLLQDTNHQLTVEKQLFDYELKRLLKRSAISNYDDDKTKNLCNDLFISAESNFQTFIQLLHICQFISRKTK